MTRERLPRDPGESVRELLDRVHLGPRQAYKQLTLWPLVRDPDAPAELEYVALRDALESGQATLDEVDEEGSVPHACVRNHGGVAVLVLFGEELRGAKQDRIPNASFLVAPFSRVVIDVSCVEQGRWGRRPQAERGGFERCGSVVSHRMRRSVARQVGQARERGRGFASDQLAVWEQVSERVLHAAAPSHTGAYRDYAASRRSDLREIRRAFRPLEDQVGFVAVAADAVTGVEAIGRPDVFARVFPRLLDAYAIDFVDRALTADELEAHPSAASFDQPEAFLASLRRARVRAAPSLGMGSDLRLGTRDLEGCALDAGGLVHLTAYPREPDSGRPRRA